MVGGAGSTKTTIVTTVFRTQLALQATGTSRSWMDRQVDRTIIMRTQQHYRWNEIAGKLRKKKGFCPLTPEEAEAAYNAAPDVPLTEDRIALIVRAVIEDSQPADE